MRVLGEARGSRKCRIFIWQRDRTGQDRTGQVHLHEVHLPGLNHSPESPSLAETIICYLICTSAGCGRGYPGSQAARRPSFHPGCLPVRLSWTAGSQSARMSEHRQVRGVRSAGASGQTLQFPGATWSRTSLNARWLAAGWCWPAVGVVNFRRLQFNGRVAGPQIQIPAALTERIVPGLDRLALSMASMPLMRCWCRASGVN